MSRPPLRKLRMAMWMRATPETKAAMHTRRRHPMLYRMKGMRATPPPGARRFLTKDMLIEVEATQDDVEAAADTTQTDPNSEVKMGKMGNDVTTDRPAELKMRMRRVCKQIFQNFRTSADQLKPIESQSRLAYLEAKAKNKSDK